MKKSLLTQILVMSAGFIVLSAVVPVNHALLPTGQIGYALVSDGAPMSLPEPPPPAPSYVATLSFDGAPMPLPEPPPPPPQILSPAASDAASINVQG